MNEFIKAFKDFFIINFIIILLLFGFKLIPSTGVLLDLSAIFICDLFITFCSTCLYILSLDYTNTKFTKMSKKEHDKTRIDIYDYIIK